MRRHHLAKKDYIWIWGEEWARCGQLRLSHSLTQNCSSEPQGRSLDAKDPCGWVKLRSRQSFVRHSLDLNLRPHSTTATQLLWRVDSHSLTYSIMWMLPVLQPPDQVHSLIQAWIHFYCYQLNKRSITNLPTLSLSYYLQKHIHLFE